MVLLAAAVCTKNGKAVVSRQFVEMTRSRIEGLLAAFPKLMNTGKQHTFVETESVRYVYQPLEKMYMLLITTKNSNILEDLETLRLFSRVIPEYCRVIDENDVQEHAFELIFAFDEVVALGYRESVNLAQIRTFTEMDSHEEKVFLAVRKSQEDETKAMMRRKAKELQQMKRDQMRGSAGIRSGSGGGMGYGQTNGSSKVNADIITHTPEPVKKPQPTRTTGKAMKLGAKSKDVDNFVDKLISEGEHVSKSMKSKKSDAVKSPAAATEAVHIRFDEKLTITANRDGGLQSMQVLGLCLLEINNSEYGQIKALVEMNDDNRGCQFQTHPNIDKRQFKESSIIASKHPDRPFPTKQPIGFLKWRLQTTDESLIPLTINCWPNDNGDGGCDVNIEYELQLEEMELIDVNISIPVPSGVGAPNVQDVDGEYKYDSRKNMLSWTLPVIDKNNLTGSMEFAMSGSPDDFFPIQVSFQSLSKPFANIQITDVIRTTDDTPVKFTMDGGLSTEKYEIV